MSSYLLYNSLIHYFGLTKEVHGAGLALTADEIDFTVDSAVITSDATVTP